LPTSNSGVSNSRVALPVDLVSFPSIKSLASSCGTMIFSFDLAFFFSSFFSCAPTGWLVSPAERKKKDRASATARP
jgi:hypothetical protein